MYNLECVLPNAHKNQEIITHLYYLQSQLAYGYKKKHQIH